MLPTVTQAGAADIGHKAEGGIVGNKRAWKGNTQVLRSKELRAAGTLKRKGKTKQRASMLGTGGYTLRPEIPRVCTAVDGQ